MTNQRLYHGTAGSEWRPDEGKCHHAHAITAAAAAARAPTPSSHSPSHLLGPYTAAPAGKADAYTRYNVGQTTGRQNSIHGERLDECKRKADDIQKPVRGQTEAEAEAERMNEQVTAAAMSHHTHTHTHQSRDDSLCPSKKMIILSIFADRRQNQLYNAYCDAAIDN